MVRAARISMLMLAVWFMASHSWAAARKAWVQLTDCQYIEQTYNAGDSFHVQCGTQAFILRLYFVDAPESNLRYPDRTCEQSEYFGVTLDETLRAGRQATLLVRERLRTPFVVWTRWASAAGRTKTPRHYGFVEIAGQSLAELLVREGLARTKGVTATGPTGTPSHSVREPYRRWNARPGNTSAASGPRPPLVRRRRPPPDAVTGSSERGTANPA